MAQKDGKTQKIFSEVSYFLASKCSEETEQSLKNGGASKEFYISDLVTHVLSDTCEFALAEEAKEYNIPIVMEHWVKMSVKAGKKLPTQPFSPKAQLLFTGMKMCPSKIPSEEMTKLWAMVTYHGGKCQLNLTASCTHLVVPRAIGEKYKMASKLEGKIKIVTPSWIVDCIKENKKMDEGLYIPIEPEKEEDIEATIKSESQEINDEKPVPMETDTSGTSLKTGETCDTSKTSKTVLEVNDKGLESAETASQITKNSSQTPEMTNNNHKIQESALKLTDDEVRPKKNGAKSPEIASKSPENASKTTENSKPTTVDTKESFKEPVNTSVGAKEGTEDVALTKEVLEIGETPVKTTGESTDGEKLETVTATRHGECPEKHNETLTEQAETAGNGERSKNDEDKMETALQDGEENTQNTEYKNEQSSILSGCVFVVTDYQTCMDHSILNTWIEVIKSNGGEVQIFYSQRCTHLLCLNQQGKVFLQAMQDGKKVVTAHWLNDVLTDKKMSVPFRPLHFPAPFPYKLPQCKNLTITVTGFTGVQRLLIKNMIYLVGATYTGYLTRSNTHVICKIGEGDKYIKAKEWGIPCVNAKWLGDIVSSGKVFPCALKKYTVYGKEDDLTVNKEFVKTLLEPWKAEIETEESNQKKRKQDERPEDCEIQNQPKKQRLSNSGTIEVNSNTPRVLFTGLTISKSAQQMKMLEELGGLAASSPRTCTHLVATKIVRTAKFLSAISVCQFIVTPDWLEKSFKAKKLLDPKLFTLRDVDTEKEYDMDLLTSIKRAQSKSLLKDVKVYSTPNVQPSPSSLKEIVEAAGGQFVTDSINVMMLSSLKALKTKDGNPGFIVVTCQEDLKLCTPFIKHGIDIHSTEIILAGVLIQQLDFETFRVKFVK